MRVQCVQEKKEYTVPAEEAVKYLLVRGWCLNKVRVADMSNIPTKTKVTCLRRRKKDGVEERPYEPDVLDLSKVGTPVEALVTGGRGVGVVCAAVYFSQHTTCCVHCSIFCDHIYDTCTYVLDIMFPKAG